MNKRRYATDELQVLNKEGVWTTDLEAVAREISTGNPTADSPERIWIDKSQLKHTRARKVGSYYFESAEDSLSYLREDLVRELREAALAVSSIFPIESNLDEVLTSRAAIAVRQLRAALKPFEGDGNGKR